MKEFRVCGNSKQETREGYNVLNLEKYPYNEAGSTLNGGTVIVKDGIMTIDSTNATASMTVKSENIGKNYGDVIQAGTYYFGVNTNGYYESDMDTLVQFQKGVVTLTDNYRLTQWFVPHAVGSVVNRALIISKDSSKTEYEQYGAMPSLKFPSPIQAIENLNIVLSNKNVLELTSSRKKCTNNGIEVTIADDGLITLNGTCTKAWWPDLIWDIGTNTANHSTCKYYFKEMNKVSFSLERVGGTTSQSIYVTSVLNDKPNEQTISMTLTSDTTKLSKTLEANVNGVNRVYLTIGEGAVIDNLQFYLHIEEGEASDYILHEHQNFVFPLYEGQRLHEEDYLADDGIHHNRTFIELDGTTTGKKVVNVSNSTGKYHQIQISNNLIKPGSRARCNIAKTTEAGSFGNAGTVTISQTTSNAYIHVEWGAISDSDATIEEVNQFFADFYNAGTPVILEIELNEEIVEGYTEEQKNVHDAIQKAKTYKNVTHMYSTNTIKPVMNVTYYKDLETINKNNAAEIAELRDLVNTLSQAILESQ